MKLIRYQQPSSFANLGNFDRFFEDALTALGPLAGSNGSAVSRSPRTYAKETETGYEFSFEIPGVERDEVKINVEQNVLTVEAGHKTTAENTESEEGVSKSSTSEVHFYSQVRIPRYVDLEQTSATLNNGILKVTLPKSTQAKARQIEIN